LASALAVVSKDCLSLFEGFGGLLRRPLRYRLKEAATILAAAFTAGRARRQ
jgi:hypothetical protein